MVPHPSLDSLPLPRRIWWPWDEPVTRVAFRREFHLDRSVQATLFVAASGEYRAWLDARPLAAPPSHAPSWRIIHQIPLKLTSGPHRLAFDATPGPHGQSFLLACLDGSGTRLITDAAWQMAANPPEAWALQQADNLAWRPAWAFDGVWAEPWGMPCNVPDDFCRLTHGWQTTETQPLSVVVQTHAGLAAATVRPGGQVELRPPAPFPAAPFPIGDVRKQDLAYRSREAHSHILNHRLELFETRCPHVVFDAGAETFGRLRLRLSSGGPAILAITTGESVPELHHHLGRVSDVFELRDGESFATGPTGFRYVKIMALSAAAPGTTIVLDPPAVQHIRYPVEQGGSFTCSDARLSEIWQLCARTAHLCMQTEIWDGIKRDQLPWMGDLYTEALAIYHAFGDTRLARWSLGVLGELGPVPDRPLTQQRYPGLQSMWKRPDTDINGIPSYTLWWVIGLADYLQYSGDRTLIEDLAAELAATLRHVADWIDADNWWRQRSGWDYVDWSPLTAAERATFCHLLACQVLHVGATLLAAIGRNGDEYRIASERLATTARDGIWRDGTAQFGPAHHLPAMLIRSGVLQPGEARALFARTLSTDPPWSMTYWHRYADLDAAWRVGAIDWGLNYIRRHWGYALELGMTALWEAFDPAWIGPDPHAVSMVAAEYARYGGYETSLCHGWSAGPAAWLHRAVLGVSPAEPGFTAIDFQPALGDLQSAAGVVPCPRGPIRVELARGSDSSRPQAHIAIPPGIEVRSSDAIRRTGDWVVATT
jgi:alpha-L-rhamnosidase